MQMVTKIKDLVETTEITVIMATTAATTSTVAKTSEMLRKLLAMKWTLEWEQGLDKGQMLVPSTTLMKKAIGPTIKDFLKERALMTAY